MPCFVPIAALRLLDVLGIRLEVLVNCRNCTSLDFVLSSLNCVSSDPTRCFKRSILLIKSLYSLLGVAINLVLIEARFASPTVGLLPNSRGAVTGRKGDPVLVSLPRVLRVPDVVLGRCGLSGLLLLLPLDLRPELRLRGDLL